MRSFYDPNIEINSESHVLSEEESAHACRVLRLKNGDLIEILDGKGNSVECEIQEAHPKKCLVLIKKVNSSQKPTSWIHIAIAPTKNMDRIEWFCEKATEMGIMEITLLQCKNNERKHVKLDRLEKILVSAMKQSKRTYLPLLNDMIGFEKFVAQHPKGLIAHCYTQEKMELRPELQKEMVPILIGPEGDFTENEVALALKSGYKGLNLGINRLRTETAALYACAVAYEIQNNG